MAYIIRQKNSP
uniref:Uncharacterized protein n=1 Tax=Arundo donax TaxID=35708 RepID=A0A0A8Z786_ARUDO